MTRWRSTIGLPAAAVSGAALAVGLVAGFGGLSGRTTTVREVVNLPEEGSEASFTSAAQPLSINEIYRRAAPGVVQITSATTQRALGSGFVIDKAGHIITNRHVLDGARSVRVSFSDNESMKARIVGTDPSSDVAVLEVDARSRALAPLRLGNSDLVQVGDPVVAIGNPFGLDRSITAGIVSALQRPITARNGFTIDHVIQTDATLDHGNSGGPLLDSRGRAIGVNGIGFAIPIDTVKDVAAQLMKTGRAEHAFLGIDGKALTTAVAELFRLPARHGVLVGGICKSSGAATSGLHAATNTVVVSGESWPLGGDLIAKVDGSSVGTTDRLRSLIAAKKPGDEVKLTVFRNGKPRTLSVKLGRQPLSANC